MIFRLLILPFSLTAVFYIVPFLSSKPPNFFLKRQTYVCNLMLRLFNNFHATKMEQLEMIGCGNVYISFIQSYIMIVQVPF